MSALPNSLLPSDPDTQETQEWLDALEAVIEQEGPERAHYLIERLVELARRTGINLPYKATTAYINTIPPGKEIASPGDHAIEHRIRSYVRWNALAMVLRANKGESNLGGHIASFASAATLYDVGYNHFWHAPSDTHGGDLVFVQGHSAPGVYARAFMLGRLKESQLENYRQEVNGEGLSSYPHPWLMPDFWQFPTVSMGLGPIMAIYQARFMKYLQDRGIAQTEGRKVWCFLGDGECDEPESMGAIGVAARERLDNLVFVVNCNLQRLDGPVRGNGKIIQELEADFRGAGWNVIKVIWGSYWDPLIARDTKGLLLKRMEECVDGEYQTFKSKDGAYVRKHFFGKYPELLEMVSNMTDDDIWRLNRGGHDPHKIYAAYAAAVKHAGQPTVILAKTIKGYGMGEAGEAQNITHQQKKMGTTSLKAFRDRFELSIDDDKLEKIPFLTFPEGSPELEYMRKRREDLGGYLPTRRTKGDPLEVPPLSAFESLLKSSEDREISTTMAFVRILATLVRDKNIGKRVVPIVPDESRTFGMEGMFRQLGIWSSLGQLYTPQDADQLMFYKEDKHGQILQEGINEAGGIMGRQIDLIHLDPQGDNARYQEFARRLLNKDKVDVLIGGITSASREAVRPIVNRTKTPYFYTNQYEGGVCDASMISIGAVPEQQFSTMIPFMVEKFGKKVYVIAADYNFGQISAEWNRKLVKDLGGTVVGEEFIPLGVSQFAQTIQNIQKAKPDFLFLLLVGSNQSQYFPQARAAGLEYPSISSVNLQQLVDEQLAKGVRVEPVQPLRRAIQPAPLKAQGARGPNSVFALGAAALGKP